MGHKSIWNIRQGGYFIGDNFLFIYIYTDQGCIQSEKLCSNSNGLIHYWREGGGSKKPDWISQLKSPRFSPWDPLCSPVPPLSVEIMDKTLAPVSGRNRTVVCRVLGARPTPSIKWFRNDYEIRGSTIQVLWYYISALISDLYHLDKDWPGHNWYVILIWCQKCIWSVTSLAWTIDRYDNKIGWTLCVMAGFIRGATLS